MASRSQPRGDRRRPARSSDAADLGGSLDHRARARGGGRASVSASSRREHAEHRDADAGAAPARSIASWPALSPPGCRIDAGRRGRRGRRWRSRGRGRPPTGSWPAASTTSTTGRVEQRGDVGGRRRRAVGGAVEQAHHPLDDQEVGARRRPGRRAGRWRRPRTSRVEVAARAAGGQGVVAGVDEVGARPWPSATATPRRAKRRHQPGGDRGLARPPSGCRRPRDAAPSVSHPGRFSTRCPCGRRCRRPWRA